MVNYARNEINPSSGTYGIFPILTIVRVGRLGHRHFGWLLGCSIAFLIQEFHAETIDILFTTMLSAVNVLITIERTLFYGETR